MSNGFDLVLVEVVLLDLGHVNDVPSGHGVDIDLNISNRINLE